MKKYTKFLTIMLLTFGFFLAGCSDDDNNNTQQGNLPSKKTVAAFQQKFPDAQGVKWTKKRGYDVATFMLKGSRAAAAAPANSAWYLEGTATCAYVDEEISPDQLKTKAPKVAAAWEASPRKVEGYVLDDIDVLTHATEAAVYKLEVEKGKLEYELYYALDGTLLLEKADTDDADDADENEPCPQAIYDFISAKFPTAVIVEFDIEDEGGVTYYEVEVNINKVEKELIFSKESKFLYVIVEIETEDLPAPVLAAFQKLAPDEETWDDVARLEDEKAAVIGYMLVVEDKNIEKSYKVDANGKTLK